MPATLVTWTFAPEWLPPSEVASLMGPAYTPEHVHELIQIGAVDAEVDANGNWLVEKRSLREYRDALWEVLTYED